MDQRVFRWFEHVERMGNDRKDINDGSKWMAVRGRPRLGLLGGAKVALGIKRDNGGGCATMRKT